MDLSPTRTSGQLPGADAGHTTPHGSGGALTRADLVRRYDFILGRGRLEPAAQERFRRGEQLPGIVVQQSGGSSGRTPLRLPRTHNEMHWLLDALIRRHREHWGRPPIRIALVGGISHLAGRALPTRSDLELRVFSLDELEALAAFRPQLLSLYPSMARDLLDERAPQLVELQTLKLGGEPVLAADRAQFLARHPRLLLLEQFGSTEMPALAFRSITAEGDSGYCPSYERYRFRLRDSGGWQALIVRDLQPGRAFPIEGWFDTGDEVRVRAGRWVGVRRRGDLSRLCRQDLEELRGRGCQQVQVLLARRLLLYKSRILRLPRLMRVGPWTLRTVQGSPYRLLDSNKLPLVIDEDHLRPTRFWRPEGSR